jgi:hypothetical protein
VSSEIDIHIEAGVSALKIGIWQMPNTVAIPSYNDDANNNSKRSDSKSKRKLCDSRSKTGIFLNDAIDALKEMTGLEEVKSKILMIKAKIETVLRQGTNIKRGRLGMVILGNPGTGTCEPVVHCNVSLIYMQAKRR